MLFGMRRGKTIRIGRKAGFDDLQIAEIELANKIESLDFGGEEQSVVASRRQEP